MSAQPSTAANNLWCYIASRPKKNLSAPHHPLALGWASAGRSPSALLHGAARGRRALLRHTERSERGRDVSRSPRLSTRAIKIRMSEETASHNEKAALAPSPFGALREAEKTVSMLDRCSATINQGLNRPRSLISQTTVSDFNLKKTCGADDGSTESLLMGAEGISSHVLGCN